MKSLWQYCQAKAWLVIVPLLLAGFFASTSMAAQAPAFSITASGSTNNLSLIANINVADADVGKNGNVYLAFLYQQQAFFNNGSQWLAYSGGNVPVYSSGALSSRSIDVIRNADMSMLVGGEIYVAYGLSENDMFSNGKFAKVYTIIKDNIAPTVSSTGTANGATGVASNSSVVATFSEAMDPASLNSSTVILYQGTTQVAGSVSYSGQNVQFIPSQPLLANSSYTATIKGGSNGAKDLAGNALVSDYVWSWQTASLTPRIAPVLLGTAGNFAILAKTGISTVPTSVITGDIGVSPVAATYITGFSLSADASNVFSTSPQVVGGGRVYAANYAVPTPSNLTTAVHNMETAYTDAAGRSTPDGINLGGGTIGGLTLAPDLYKWGSSVMITTDLTLAGNANEVWIFQISGDLLMSAAKQIVLSGGAQAKNIFWQVAGQATIGTTAHFEGIILSQTGITLQTGAVMNGRALAQSMVALDSATVIKPQ